MLRCLFPSVCLVLALFGCSRHQAVKLTDPSDDTGKWGSPMEGLRSSLVTDKQVYPPGADPVFTFRLQSISEKPIAAVPPSRLATSQFSQLLEFIFCRFGQEDSRKWFDATVKYTGRGTLNPGAGEYALFPRNRVYTATFRLSELESSRKRVILEPGEHEVVVKYFIRGSTPFYDGRDFKGAIMWAGHHLKTNPVRFVVKKKEEQVQPGVGD